MSAETPSEERFRRLVEIAPDTVLLHAGGELIFVNPAGVRLLGANSAEELVGRQVADIVDAEGLATVEKLCACAVMAGLVDIAGDWRVSAHCSTLNERVKQHNNKQSGRRLT